jgi:hypothetical protein
MPRARLELDVSNQPYAPGPDPTASAAEGVSYTDPYATGQSTAGGTYQDLPSQPADVSYGSAGQSTAPDGSAEQSTVDTAKGEAAAVKDTAVDAGKNVAATARDEASNVAAEARYQAKSLLGSVTEEARSQASTQQSKLAETVHSLSKELGGMASSSAESGPLTDLAHQAARKGGEIAHWLEDREPADVLEEVRAFARRRPVMFLGLCALAGVVAGRLTRGAVAANTSLDSKTDDSPRRLSSADSYYATRSAGYSTPQAGYTGSGQAAAGDYAAGVPQSGYPTGTDYPATGQPAAGGDYSAGVPQSGYPTGTQYPAGTEYPAEGAYSDQQGGEGQSAPYPPSTGAAGGMPSSGSGYADEEGRQQPYGGESNR